MTSEEVKKPLKDLVKGLNGMTNMLEKLKTELPKSMPKDEAEKLATEIQDLGVIERVNELQDKLNNIR